jgi:hypothetical protein
MGPRRRRRFMREMREIESCTEMRWLTLEEMMKDQALLAQYSHIYTSNLDKFNYPATHYSRDVLTQISQSRLADYFHIGLTFYRKHLVRVIVCFVEWESKYLAGLVHGIDYQQPITNDYNFYNHIYASVYKFMDENGLKVFDMGRGYVEHKLRMGATKVELLHTYLKPSEKAKAYAETLQRHTRGIAEQYRHYEAVRSRR